ncbi:MAG: hypothetical protein WBM15_07365, partial [Chromatiaceae bacterium]
QMKFYVPSQAASGGPGDPLYYNVDGEQMILERDLAKPLIGVKLLGPVIGVEGVGFVGHGKRDTYAAVSLDDGDTWKKTNLSQSADLTSCDSANCDVLRPDVPLFADTDYQYPGDVTNLFHSIMGNKVLVAWQSRYCAKGQPSYSLDDPDATSEQIARRAAIATYLGIDLTKASKDDIYLIDMYMEEITVNAQPGWTEGAVNQIYVADVGERCVVLGAPISVVAGVPVP